MSPTNPRGPSGATSTTSPAFADLLELLGRRWTLRLLWELRGGALSFNELRARSGGLSQSVLVTRLTELYGAGLVADVDNGYELTAPGQSLVRDVAHLDKFATKWTRDR
jgi:DNA-binding HxlR family transcriptional regulator